MNSQAKTGRTTRMLLDALRLCRARQQVYVVATNIADITRLNRMLDALGRTKEEIDGLAFVKVVSSSGGNFDWDLAIVRGAYSGSIVLIDHWAIESHFSYILSMLTRYDLPITKGDK